MSQPPERKVVLYTLMSLDGAVDDPASYFSPAPADNKPPDFDAEMEQYEADVIATQDAVLLGRNMYDEWSGYWPSSDVQPFADFINGVKKYVITSSPLARPWHNSEAVAGPPADVIRDLRSQPGGDIGVHGSIHLATSLLEAGLVDELQLVVGPVVGCPGRRLFEASGELRRMTLLNAQRTPSGSLLLAYRVR